MGLDWWKMHHSLLDDPALLKTPPDLVGWWVRVLAVTCRRGGVLGDLDDEGELEKLASVLRLESGDGWDIERAREIVAALRSRRLLERSEGIDRPRNWSKFQGETPDAGRMRKMRERQANERNGYVTTVTGGDVTRVTKSRRDKREETEPGDVIAFPATDGLFRREAGSESGDLLGGYESFIAAYPNQANTDAACREWISLADVGEITPAVVPEIMAGLGRWLISADWEREQGRFIPRPDNWLRRRLWRDNPPKGDAAKSKENIPEWSPARRRRDEEAA
ncbi:MAG: hypothetical protein NTV52_33645 [Acidobacteria bacterium]|nr:hypothetical protein [Acidobacteriota bacterium]